MQAETERELTQSFTTKKKERKKETRNRSRPLNEAEAGTCLFTRRLYCDA